MRIEVLPMSDAIQDRISFLCRAFGPLAVFAVSAVPVGLIGYHVGGPLAVGVLWFAMQFYMMWNVDFALTHSCYDPDQQGRSCGRCDSCRLRLKGFAEAGLNDPVEYQIPIDNIGI